MTEDPGRSNSGIHDVCPTSEVRAPSPPPPIGILAELTHRCPLGCPYCSNPLALDARDNELDTQTWARVFREAVALGVMHVHLSGGEPGARRDLEEITAAAHASGLYTNLITSGVGITAARLGRLSEAGLDHVQISIQDSEPASADHIANYRGAFARKKELAAAVRRLKIPLTVNAVMHRANIERIGAMVELAMALGGSRSRDRSRPVLWLGFAQPRGFDADRRSNCARHRDRRRFEKTSPGRDRHRCRAAGLSCAVPEALRRRLGTALAERNAIGKSIALSCSGNTCPRVLVGA